MLGADIIISSFSLAYEAKIFPNDSAFCSNSSLPIVASIVCRLVQATLLLDSRRFENTILNFGLYNKMTKICNHNYGLYYNILTVSAMKVSDLISRLTASLMYHGELHLKLTTQLEITIVVVLLNYL